MGKFGCGKSPLAGVDFSLVPSVLLSVWRVGSRPEGVKQKSLHSPKKWKLKA